MSVSPFEHPYLSGLLGDADMEAPFSVEADASAMLAFEVALAKAQAEVGLIPAEAAKAIEAALAGFSPDVEALKLGVGRDGVVVPELVRQLRQAVAGDAAAFVHVGATSQDVVDTSLALRLKPVLAILDARLAAVSTALQALDDRDGAVEVMAHTRMQAAIPVAASRKIRSWRDPLARHRERLDAVAADIGVVHFGGAAGTLEKLGDRAGTVTKRLADLLDLRPVDRARHSERDGVAGLASWLSLVTGSLGKMGQDIALAAQSEVGEIKLSGGGGSSAMPHKVNPVGAETLVTLARFNATLLAGMHQSLVHENERSGAAWTLEWMLLPQMVMACGVSLRIAQALLAQVSFRPGGADMKDVS
ncbi:3-carboxy-cis,cis-muconate cycloisomerase [Aquibium carbonis]|uniref:3-carboxy-cis,cis-muconate cycloisomerase n=1 Tax=Aquibium carbonis TaxID=2495581 RepID=A0A3S0G5X0_9HYPH|nr:3-carboxy-cis,cis-muconate cycloisomerase [Aquibium carbonis]RST84491.1 3-carboxy-cis,cis-muconate cycloisomerase [Aquibium carbonis]